jgi:hypothetical protein
MHFPEAPLGTRSLRCLCRYLRVFVDSGQRVVPVHEPQPPIQLALQISQNTEQPAAVGYRIQGPNLVIEYSPQSLGGDPSMHIHTIYRDPTNDYGRKFTAK